MRLNRTIQRQNAVTQRQSSWLARWAEDFLKTASTFDESVTSFYMLWYLNHVKSVNNLTGAVEEQRSLHLESLQPVMDLQRSLWELSKYASFAPITGSNLEKAANALSDEVSGWLRNKGGDVQVHR